MNYTKSDTHSAYRWRNI